MIRNSGRRLALVALLVPLIASLQLGPVLSSGVHEVWLDGSGDGYGSIPRVRVYLHDHTGLVRGIRPAGDREESSSRAFVAHWLGGCGDYRTDLAFTATRDGYRLTERTARWGCVISIGDVRAVAVVFWAPVDPALVHVEADFPV